MIQASLKYNVKQQPKKQKDNGEKSFVVKQLVAPLVDPAKPDHCKWRKMTTCVTYGGDENSGMVMVDVKMVSGWIPDKDSLKETTKNNVKIKRFDVDSRMVSFYLDDLVPTQEFCFHYLVEQNVEIGNPKEGLVKVYDYYEPDIVVDKKYKIKQTCGTKEEIPFFNPPVTGEPSLFEQRRSEEVNPRPNIFIPHRNDPKCPDCVTPDFAAAFCGASKVYSASVLSRGRVQIYKEHKRNHSVAVAQRNYRYGEAASPVECLCDPMQRMGYVMFLVKDDDFLVGNDLWLNDDVSIVPLGGVALFGQQPIENVIPYTLMAQARENC